MGSPFVNPTTTSLDLISQSGDYTRSKGWELLQRNFGCGGVTAYPYFVLYNRFSGLIRVFVYQPDTQPHYSSIMVHVEPTKSPWPATTSLGDDRAITPDKYFSGNQAGNYGKLVAAVGENAGSSRWTVAEFIPGFDHNIQNELYRGTGLKFTLYGVLVNDMKAVIKGKSVSGTDPVIYSFNYVPKTTPTNNNGNTDFTGTGEKFLKFSKSVSEFRSIIFAEAERTSAAIAASNPEAKGPEAREKANADAIAGKAATPTGFDQLLSDLTTSTSTLGNLIKFVGEVVGMFNGGTGTPAAMPTYSSYDMELRGTLTAKSVQQTFIIRVPGALTATDNQNPTYYQCPMGIFNLQNTPQADTITYDRAHLTRYQQCCIGNETSKYISYRMRNIPDIVYNSGAGLDLVSVQAAIVGKVQADENGNPKYNPFAEHQRTSDGPYYLIFVKNFMLPDLQSGRLEIANYDTEKKLHSIQTPYVNLECLNGLAFNAPINTDVSLRVKAILKKKNDPDNAPIVYIQDYNIEVTTGTFDADLRNKHKGILTTTTPTPYSNFTEYPSYTSNKTVAAITYAQATEEKADNSVSTQNGASIIVPASQTVVYKAGNEVQLLPGFEARQGSEFLGTINKFGYTLTCSTPATPLAFTATGNCYNTTAVGLRTATGQKSSVADSETPSNNNELKVFPIPSQGDLMITGIRQHKDAVISIVDQSGRLAQVIKALPDDGGRTIKLNLGGLNNGVYFIKIQSPVEFTVRKIVINK
ncbi:3-coathanger stack domain-containing protein [Paraflavitalea sp. CAU 1676]|uniref:3-coathanger stack domain-containing protein n=1 Tax=Paraflavitalea sp. CAU 1676 TaxID=3032598 RepID=UPI0023DC478A|nr:3-coathanger stack domain-containing protein [Paraflavitalea sp. CAU 1676]MDF2192999.1 T9SS type A sorting domain-containing protein [Paraflavitalea sp. CAU 1676]